MEVKSMWNRTLAICLTLMAAATFATAQGERGASPPGTSATQLGENGKWIEITSGRPIKRGRDVFGSGDKYAQLLLSNGAKVWRAGANVSTRLKTEAPLRIGGKAVPAGEYSLFIDTKSPTDWTLIVSSWAAKTAGNDPRKDALWGSYNYTPDKDVARVAMKVDKLPLSIDQLTWNFADVTPTAGKFVIMWDTVVATAPFTVGQ
jgi:hypothetical protein